MMLTRVKLETIRNSCPCWKTFGLPRREGGRGTEISTLPGGQNLGEITDIQYFQKKLYKVLGCARNPSRWRRWFQPWTRSSEILRDELRFNKFVGRLRKRFSNMFLDMLKTQLLLKNVIAAEDWAYISEHIQFDYIYDNHFAELKEAELFQNRMGNLDQVEPYVGKYFSQDYLRRKVLRQTDDEIVEQNKLIEKEIEAGLYVDPAELQRWQCSNKSRYCINRGSNCSNFRPTSGRRTGNCNP